MGVIEWIRFLSGAFFLLCGLLIFLIEMVGVFRFKYVLNRMHAAAMGDTLGIASSLIGLMLISGLNFTSLKLFCIIVFLWFSSPTSSHLIARLEVATDEKRDGRYSIINLDKPEEKRKEGAEANGRLKEGAEADGRLKEGAEADGRLKGGAEADGKRNEGVKAGGSRENAEAGKADGK